MATWSEYKKTMQGEDEIFTFARDGDLLALNAFVVQGGDVNLKNHKGHSLLMLTAYHEHEEACAFLLQAGADANARDKTGSTILMGAAFKGYAHIVLLLLKRGADPRLRNYMGMTALGVAQAFARDSVIAVLKEAYSESSSLGANL